MNEIVLSNKKNGMAVLLITILMYLLAIAACIFGSFIIDSPLGIILLVISIIWLCIGWIPVMGLKVLKPQEALVLTLFGKYIGTLKNEGFLLLYFSSNSYEYIILRIFSDNPSSPIFLINTFKMSLMRGFSVFPKKIS